MQHRAVREGMQEAHENKENYGGEWYVLSDGYKAVVKESYFITNEGDRKVKPFTCLYCTKDMRYGRHTIQWIDGKVEIDPDDVKERFKQPYDEKFVEEGIRPVGIGHDFGVIGMSRDCLSLAHKVALEHAIKRTPRLIEGKGMTSDLVSKLDDLMHDFKTSDAKRNEYMITAREDWSKDTTDYSEPKEFNMATGKMKKMEIPRDMDEKKRKALKFKRKKKGKKTHRKKKRK